MNSALSNKNNNDVMLSISCITFNHVGFIKQSLDGMLMQKTDFFFEILINDDCSTDNTKEIIGEYANKYPNIIFPIFQKENQYSKGFRGMNARFNFPRARGKYIALCEGDDYWTDPLKLQKQIDFLEANNEYNLCGHKVSILKMNGDIIDSSKYVNKNDELTFDDVATKRKNIPTSSIVFRNNVNFPPWVYKVYGGDRALIFLNAQVGKIKILNFNASVYRIHEGGVEQRYKNNKFALPMRNIKEQFIYYNVLSKRAHKKTIFNNIIYNHFYILTWSLLKINLKIFFISLFSLFSFLIFHTIKIK
jgi:glycosyltransferase involved in cell wall biosynthesis